MRRRFAMPSLSGMRSRVAMWSRFAIPSLSGALRRELRETFVRHNRILPKKVHGINR